MISPFLAVFILLVLFLSIAYGYKNQKSAYCVQKSDSEKNLIRTD